MKIPSHTTSIITATLLFSGITVSPVIAQNEPTKADSKTVISAEELESRKASIVLIEARIKDREEQLTVIANDINRLSKRVEARIEKIVNTLESIKDSQNSKIRVAKLKQDTMKGLYRSIENYNSRRRELSEQLRTGDATIGNEAAEKGIQKFDAQVEKRIDQMVKISKSFTEHADYKKYESDNSYNDGYYNGNGWGWDNTRVSEEWKQNRRETKFTDGQRKKMISGLKASIDDLERRNNTLRNKSRAPGVSEELKKFYLEDIKKNEASIASRGKQLSEIMMSDNSSNNTKSVSRNQAHDTELMIREIANDIQRDSREITRNYNELKQRLARLNKTKKNLAARQAWLKEYEATEKK